jgi:FO synthase
MHAVARLIFHGLIDNIQVSWVKMGLDGVRACLSAGANDLGGSLMNESITRAAGAEHGQEWSPAELERVISSLGRRPRMRTTLYAEAPSERRGAAMSAPELLPLINQGAGRQQCDKRLDGPQLVTTAAPAPQDPQQVVMIAACN